MKTTDEIRARAGKLLSDAAGRMDGINDAILQSRAAKGGLRSGGTIVAAVQSFQAVTASALEQILSEVATVVEHRGKVWSAAMRAVEDELELHIARAPDLLEGPFRMSGGRGSANEAGHALIATARGDLRSQLSSFEDGWTAPPGKGWHERHPVIYAIGLLLLGAVAGAIATGLAG